MDRHETSKRAGQADLVRIGGRAYRIRTQVVIEEVEGDEAEGTSEVCQQADGCFERMLSDADATSIDKAEQAILQTSWPAMRDALARHLSAVSQKKPSER
jgi:hypothetical protein